MNQKSKFMVIKVEVSYNFVNYLGVNLIRMYENRELKT